jgi:hypothetical protein
MKWKSISLLKTRIYPQRFLNASAVTWSLVLQMRNLANKIEEFSKCDDFSGEIIKLSSPIWHYLKIATLVEFCLIIISHVGIYKNLYIFRIICIQSCTLTSQHPVMTAPTECIALRSIVTRVVIGPRCNDVAPNTGVSLACRSINTWFTACKVSKIPVAPVQLIICLRFEGVVDTWFLALWYILTVVQ